MEVVGEVSGDTDPSAIVKFTQNLRYKIVKEMTSDGTYIPDKPGDLLLVLRDMDQSALTTRKLNIDEQGISDGRRTIDAYNRLEELLGGRNPFAISDDNVIPVAVRAGPLNQNLTLPQVVLRPGEDHQGEHSLNVADFVLADE